MGAAIADADANDSRNLISFSNMTVRILKRCGGGEGQARLTFSFCLSAVRREAEAELRNMENELKAKLLEIRG